LYQQALSDKATLADIWTHQQIKDADEIHELTAQLDEARAEVKNLRILLAPQQKVETTLYSSTDERVSAARAERDTLRALLRELEWRGATSLTYPSTLLPSCPSCGRTRAHRHREDCRLRAALE